MKKLLSIAIMLLMVITVSGQGTWNKIVVEPDELKGEKGGITYIYTQEGLGSFVVWDWDEYQFRLVSDNGIFNINEGGWLKTLVGIYDASGKMVEKLNLWLSKEEGSGYSHARTVKKPIPPGQKSKVKKIFTAIKEGNGYVRIIATRYDKADFDIKILSIKE